MFRRIDDLGLVVLSSPKRLEELCESVKASLC